jgi:hypothetical protein
MAHTLLIVLLFFVLLISPCVVANSVDMDEEEAIADCLQQEYDQQGRAPSS